MVFPDLGGATTGNGGGALTGAAGIGGGALPAVEVGGGGTPALGGGGGGGATGAGAFGLSLNFPGSAAGAGSAVGGGMGGGEGGAAGRGLGAAAEGTSAAGGGEAGELDAVAGAGATSVGIRAFRRIVGAAPGVAAGAGVGVGAGAANGGGGADSEKTGKSGNLGSSGNADGADASGVGAVAGAEAASPDNLGLKRIFGGDEGSGLAAADGAAGIGTSAGGGGVAGGGFADGTAAESEAGAAGAAAGVCPSGGRSRGLRRSEGGGVCSSLMRLTKAKIRLSAKTKTHSDPRKADQKVSLAVSGYPPHGETSILMTKTLLLSVVCTALMFSTGCLFSKKSGRPKESSAIAADVEETFRQRWMEKRVAELTAQGTAAEAARTQAQTEFREKYGFNPSAKK